MQTVHILISLMVFTVSIILIHLIFIKIKLYLTSDNVEKMINISPVMDDNIKWKRADNCNNTMNEALKDILKDNNITETKGNDWKVYLPCTYNHIKQETGKVVSDQIDQRVYIIDKADDITSKSTIWKHLANKYGRNLAKKFMPNTYMLYNEKDRELFKKEFDKRKLYIMKKNIQRQKGLKITNNLSEILSGYKEKYVVVQELLQDPYLINDRKINMRFYLLITCKDNKLGAFIHNNGFMYYTKEPFKKGSLRDEPNITTGYIDREVYDVNPLTLEDFRMYLDSVSRIKTDYEKELMNKNIMISKLVFKRVLKLFYDILLSVENVLCVSNNLNKNVTFQLFGADIALNDRLYPQLIEINKGPDLSAKDERDGYVKRQVQEDILKVIKIIPKNNHEFIPVF